MSSDNEQRQRRIGGVTVNCGNNRLTVHDDAGKRRPFGCSDKDCSKQTDKTIGVHGGSPLAKNGVRIREL